MPSPSKSKSAWAAALCVVVGSGPAVWAADRPQSLNPIDIEEWQVPYAGRARDPFALSADEVWFVGQSTHYLACFIPSSGEFWKRDLPDESGPHNLIVGTDGIVWYAGNLKGYIGRYDPKTDVVTRFHMPNPAARDPHTLVFDEGERHIWFTGQHGNFIGRLTLANGKVDIIFVPTERARPYGIRMAPDGTPWIVLLGTHKLAAVDPESLELTEYVIPEKGARPRRLEVSADGRVWYADYARGFLGVYDPESGSFGEWALPSGELSRPYGTALDRHGRIWVVATGVAPNLFVGFDTDVEKVISITPIPSRAGSVRHMDYHAESESVWFGTDAQTLGRADVSLKQGESEAAGIEKD